MPTILLPDGYNGDVVECDATPISSDGVVARYAVVGAPYLVKYALVENVRRITAGALAADKPEHAPGLTATTP